MPICYKIKFDGQKYRTPKFKEGFEFIYQEISELQEFEKEKGDKLSNASRLVHNILQLSNLFLQDLEKLRDFTARLKAI